MSDSQRPTSLEVTTPVSLEHDGTHADFEVGQWYWVSDPAVPTREPWFGCILSVGSNFVEVHSPSSGMSHCSQRFHLNETHLYLRREPNPGRVIQENILRCQEETNRLLNEARNLTSKLGVRNYRAIPGSAPTPGQDLAIMSGEADVGAYRQALEKAKEEDLPAIFNAIKETNQELADWMSAECLPMKAHVDGLKGSISTIEDRIFNISLYAGLIESIDQCAEGEPASMSDKLHIMQRKLYMDEECILDYRAGGMEFRNIRQFDEWLSKPKNRDRIMPFPRCIVAMQVRRNAKERDWLGSLIKLMDDMAAAASDRSTFLYIRNGERIYRLTTDLDFGEMIFPDQDLLNLSEQMMVKRFGRTVDQMMTAREFEVLKKEHDEREALHDQWRAENPTRYYFHSPYYQIGSSFRPGDWSPFDQDNLYYDESLKHITDQAKRYNRISLIVQGLFDRSEVLHPHPPVKSWTSEGFHEAIVLVRDSERTLHHGEAPDFEAYWEACNRSLGEGSVVVGQRDYWMRREADKHNNKLAMGRATASDYRPTHLVPYGNPGPNYIDTIQQWKPRARKAVFTWYREKRTWGYANDEIRTSVTVPDTALFNVSAYKKGDYLKFFSDPRTRADYLKWAPFLMAAEEYHSGIPVTNPGP